MGNYQSSPIERRVMRRVYVVYAWRRMTHPVVLKAGAVVLALLATASLVSVPHILANMPENPSRAIMFFVAAFAGTKITVQLLTLATIGFVAWILKDAFVPRYAGA